MIGLLIIIIYIIGVIVTSSIYYALFCLDYRRRYGEYDTYNFKRYYEESGWAIGMSIGAIFWPVGLVIAVILYVTSKINLKIKKYILYNESTNSTSY